MFAQTGGNIDAFVCAAGTGGTIGGMSRYLKEKKPDCKVYLIDPEVRQRRSDFATFPACFARVLRPVPVLCDAHADRPCTVRPNLIPKEF